MSDTQISLQPEHYYHIYNHAIGNENLFNQEEDFIYFITQIKKHILPLSTLYSYCLMPNHFHFLVRIKSETEIKQYLNSKRKGRTVEGRMKKNESYMYNEISRSYGNCFNAYAKHYNFFTNRTGSIFKRAFRRKIIEDIDYLRKLICYIHLNPIEAGLAAKPEDWNYSSYRAFISSEPTLLPKEEIIRYFGNMTNFIFCHTNSVGVKL